MGAAVVIDPEQPGPGIVTERDLLQSVAEGEDPNAELVANHLSADLTFASPDWSLERAAEAMVRGGFRHLVVVDGGELSASSPCATSSAAGSRTAPHRSCRGTWPTAASARAEALRSRDGRRGSTGTA